MAETAKKIFTLITLLIIVSAVAATGQGMPPVDTAKMFPEGGNAYFWNYFHRISDALPERKFPPNTKEEWEARRPEVRREVMQALGIGSLEKTPLNVKSVGVIEKTDFTIEKIIFESRPGFYVTGNLWKPRGVEGRLPVILWVHGHNEKAKAGYGWPQYGFVSKGIMAFAIDGVGFGERTPQIHAANTVCWTTGTSTMGFEIWDNIRAIDYLLTRGDVDPSRIGVAGRSGGGTQTLYMLGVETRIRAAVVMAGMSTFQKAYVGNASGHCPCNYTPFVLSYVNTADILAAAAPDTSIFVMQGSLDTLFPAKESEESVRLANKVVDLYDGIDKIRFFTDAAQHPASNKQIALEIKFFTQTLNPDVKDYSVPKYEEPPVDEIAVGFPKTSRTTIDICAGEAFKTPKPEAGTLKDWEAAADTIRKQLSTKIFGGFAPVANGAPVSYGKTDAGSYSVEMFTIETETGFRIPVAVYTPAAASGKLPVSVIVFRRGNYGMNDLVAAKGDPFKATGREGMIVVPDMRGLGMQSALDEGRMDKLQQYTDYGATAPANLIGRPIAGMRALDLMGVVSWLAGREDVDAGKISLVSMDDTAHIALLAAVMDARISETVLNGTPNTFFMRVLPKGNSIDFHVPGIMKIADIPLLASLVAPRILKITLLPDASAEPFEYTKTIYSLTGKQDSLSIGY